MTAQQRGGNVAEVVEIPIADLLVDERNPRLKDEQPSQQAAIYAIAKLMGRRILRLAEDIVEHGMDPTTLCAVVPTGDRRKRYVVVEGNRRVVALKLLETPSLALLAFQGGDQKKLTQLSQRFAANPISKINCVLFRSEGDAARWIKLRHTGANEGVGLVEWGADEKDRWAARSGRRSTAGQVLDLVEKSNLLSPQAASATTRILTNLERLVKMPYLRERLGMEKVGDKLVSHFPESEVLRGLIRIVEDLKTQTINVGDLYDDRHRVQYIDGLPASVFPKKSTRLAQPANRTRDRESR